MEKNLVQERRFMTGLDFDSDVEGLADPYMDL